MFVTHLSVTDFRNYAAAELDLVAGVNVFIGSNGQGKTNLVRPSSTSRRCPPTASRRRPP